MSPRSEPKSTRKRKHAPTRRDPTSELTPSRIQDIHVAFASVSVDDPEQISIQQAKKALKSLGVKLKTDEILRRLSTEVNDAARSLDLTAFTRLAAQLLLQNDRIQRTFDLMDVEKKGFLTWHDLQRIACELDEDGDDVDNEQGFQEMIDIVDHEDKGFLDRHDFLHLARKVNL